MGLYELWQGLLSQGWVLKTLGFAVLVGSIMALIRQSGGIEAFVEFLQTKTGIVKSPRSALLLSYFAGIFIFVESSITSLISGAIGRPFCKKYSISHAKLAYVCDSTSAPTCSLLVINGWGALLLGLIATQITLHTLGGNAVDILFSSILYNFYAMSALVMTFLVIWFDINIGPMKRAKYYQKSEDLLSITTTSHLRYMLVPILSMIFFVFFYLYQTGEGDIMAGSGSSAVFYTMVTTLFITFVLYVLFGEMRAKDWGRGALRGALELLPIAFILLLAFSIGEVTSMLKTGEYLAALASNILDKHFVASIIFVLSAIIAFATGTSWGTFSIMIPVATPLALGMDADVALCIGAVISGGVFGDHCSPISDTTIISSIASACDVVEHTKTQLPYALISALIALLLFTLFGFLN